MMMRTMLPRLTRFVYILGTVMLMAGMVLSVVTVPVKASPNVPQSSFKIIESHEFQPITIRVCKDVIGGYVIGHYTLYYAGDYDNLKKWKLWIWGPFMMEGVLMPGQGDQTIFNNNCGNPPETPTDPPTDTPTVTETPTETLTETPTETLTETPTETLTETPTETLTETPTETLTETPTETLTETPTETPEIVDLEISFICSPLFSTREAEATVVWSVYNPNDFEISFTWTLDGGLPASGKVLGLSSLESYATSTTGVHTMLVTWTYEETTYSTTYTTPAECCQEETKTPTKPPVTPTDPPIVTEETQVTRGTLAPPVVEGGPVLIPVTGDDQSIAPMGSISFGSLFSNLGMMFLGIGLVLTAISKKLHL